MKTVCLPNYNIYIDRSFDNYDRFLSDLKGNKLFVVTDENVYFLYKDTFESKIKNKDIFWYVLIDGDCSKQAKTH